MARHDSCVIKQIAILLQPSVGLARREAVATALANAVCNEDCARITLHYLERRWTGEGIHEDITNIASHFDSVAIEKEQSHVAEQLNKTLAANDQSTLTVLRNTYGLGSPVPSAFSLNVVTALHFTKACRLIAASKNALLDSSKKDELEKISRELSCESPSSMVISTVRRPR
jgi:hypothetical protein